MSKDRIQDVINECVRAFVNSTNTYPKEIVLTPKRVQQLKEECNTNDIFFDCTNYRDRYRGILITPYIYMKEEDLIIR